MKIVERTLRWVKPYDRNPRRNGDAVDAVAKSIESFGFRQPIVVDSEGVIIVGHTRYEAAQKLGIAKVPVHVATGLSAEQIKAYRIADNRTGELSDWDAELLALELGELDEADFDRFSGQQATRTPADTPASTPATKPKRNGKRATR